MHNSILDNEPWFPMSEAEKKSIDLGLEDLKNGNFVSHEEVMRGAQELIDQQKEIDSSSD